MELKFRHVLGILRARKEQSVMGSGIRANQGSGMAMPAGKGGSRAGDAARGPSGGK